MIVGVNAGGVASNSMSMRDECTNPKAEQSQSCVLQHVGICAGLSANLVEKLNAMGRRRIVAIDQYIFKDGEEVTSFATIVSGMVKLIKTTKVGEQQIIALMYPAEFLGFTFADHHRYSAMAATTAELYSYSSQPFRRLQAQFPELERKILELTLRELEICREWTLLLGRKSSYERVAGFLVLMASRMSHSDSMLPSNDGAGFRLPLARGEVADCLGLSLETVSRTISRLKRQGLIELRSSREIVVHSLPLLSAAAKMDYQSGGGLS